MLIGAVDPLEGSVAILAGTGLAALAAVAERSPHRKPLWWAFFLVAVGVAAMFALSALGGVGGPGGLSNWWGLLLAPYPVGWVLGLVAVFRMLRDAPAGASGVHRLNR
jgi:hypothetical protein